MAESLLVFYSFCRILRFWRIYTKWKPCNKAVSNFIWSRIAWSVVTHKLFLPFKIIFPVIFNFCSCGVKPKCFFLGEFLLLSNIC